MKLQLVILQTIGTKTDSVFSMAYMIAQVSNIQLFLNRWKFTLDANCVQFFVVNSVEGCFSVPIFLLFKVPDVLCFLKNDLMRARCLLLERLPQV